MAVYWQEQGNCEKALSIMENIVSSHSFLDGYLRLEYTDIIGECIKEEIETDKKIELINKVIQTLKENTVIQPSYTRNWLFLGIYTNYLIEANNQTELKEEANYYFEKAHSLSPKRQEILKAWTKSLLLTGEYQMAGEKAQECIDINDDYEECWPLALSAYTKTGNHLKLIPVYQKLIELEPENFQYYASMAFCYKMTGDYEKAREAAYKVMELSPESKASIEEFLRTLK